MIASHFPGSPPLKIPFNRVTFHSCFSRSRFLFSYVLIGSRILVSHERTHTSKRNVNEGSRSINLEAPGLKFSPPRRLSSYRDIFGITWTGDQILKIPGLTRYSFYERFFYLPVIHKIMLICCPICTHLFSKG